MLNYIWLGLIVAAVLLGGAGGQLKEVTVAAFEACKTAVMTIALPLAGVMALWLGVMRLAEKSGLMHALAKLLRPIMTRIFPDVPAEHPAMGSMIMNMAANMLGLANAATPLGLRAMQDLEKLNPRPGTATNAMCTFLALNTSSVQLIPASAIAVLAAAGSVQPTAIIGTALVATACSTIAGLISVKTLEKLPFYRLPPAEVRAEATKNKEEESGENALAGESLKPMAPWGRILIAAFGLFFALLFWRTVTVNPPPVVALTSPASNTVVSPGSKLNLAASATDTTASGAAGLISKVEFLAGSSVIGEASEAPYAFSWSPPPGRYVVTARATDSEGASTTSAPVAVELREPSPQKGRGKFASCVDAISLLAIPFLLAFFPLYAALRRVPVYEEFVEGAKEGMQVALRIIPFLVAILVAIAMFRAAGGIDLLSRALDPLFQRIGFPTELLPLVLMRPLSGSGTMGIFSELVMTHGPDSLLARMAGTIMGSTETTFYVIAVYFGSVAIRRTRHAVPAGLIADLTGVVASIIICRIAFA